MRKAARSSDSPPTSYVYVVGEVEEPMGPVKIGMTYAGEAKAGRSGLTEGNWRTLRAEHTRIIPWADLRWFEWRVHQALRPWHRRGEWFDVRHLLPTFGGWDELLDAALGGTVPGAEPCDVGEGDHLLIGMAREWPASPIRFTATCQCGQQVLGDERKAFISVLRQFETEHLGLATSNRRGSMRRKTER